MLGLWCFRSFPIAWLLASTFTIVGCSSSPSTPWVELIKRVPFQTALVKNHKMAYLDVGEGTPIILIHGFGGSMWHWEYQYLPFARTHRVLIPDLIGSGLSDKPEINYSPEQVLTYFVAFMDRLEIKRATLIGNSMGAGLAMAMALDHPDRVERLVLISGFPAQVEPSVALPQFQQILHYRPPLWLASMGNDMAGRGSTERFLKDIVHQPEMISPAVIERSFQNRQREDLLMPLYSLLDHIDSWDERYGQRLNSISHPTLLLWGVHDRVFPLEIGKQVQGLLPHAEWHDIPKAGHLPQWEQPNIVNPIILSFLEKDL